MKKELLDIIKKDVYRYNGNYKIPNILYLKFRNVSLYYIILFRKAHYFHKNNNKILEVYYRFRLNVLSRKYLIQIPFLVNIDVGLNIVHYGRIIIAPESIIGKNCNIFTGTTIGTEVRGSRKGAPAIGDCVWIGPNVVIVGKVKIGNNVMISANSFVNFDVPDNSIVIGNPAKIIYNQNATEKYINLKV